MISEKISSELQGLLNTPVDPAMFPVKKGNRINIGSYSIRLINGLYHIKSYKSNAVVARTYTKTAALAVAKSLSKNNSIEKIIKLDDEAAKHRTDCMFYKYTMEKTKNKIKWESTWVRWDISKTKERDAIDKIKQFIL